MTTKIEIKGLDKLAKKINTLEKMEGVKAALQKGGKHIMETIKDYPPESAANRPPVPYYIRGRGTQTTSGNLLNSEDLGQQWSIKTRDQGMTVVVGNSVSYAPFVQSHDRQAWFHKKRKWKTDKQVMEKEKDHVIDTIKDDIQKVIDS